MSDDAAGDLWNQTVSTIPTVYGRLAYLSGLRDANTGRYEHHGLALMFGEGAAHNALRSTHTRCFREWMSMTLEQQKADLDVYIVSLGVDAAVVARTWNDIPGWRNLLPASIRGAERKQFLEEAQVLMARLLRLSESAGHPDPDASRGR